MIHAKTNTFLTRRSAGGGFVGLLDEFPGAAFAASVRLLRADYSGALIRVRRSTDNQEKDFLPDANFEISLNSQAVVGSQTLGNFVGSGDGFVTAFYDQSSNGNNATQTTASNQPQIVDSGVLNLENGKPAIKSGTGITLTGFQASVNLTTPITSVAVAKITASNSNNYITDGDDRFIVGNRSTGNYGIFQSNWIEDGAVDINNSKIFFALYNGVSSSITVNNVTTNGNAGLAIVTSIIVMGGSPFYNGSFQELIIWNDNESGNQTGIQTNINDYYTIY